MSNKLKDRVEDNSNRIETNEKNINYIFQELQKIKKAKVTGELLIRED